MALILFFFNSYGLYCFLVGPSNLIEQIFILLVIIVIRDIMTLNLIHVYLLLYIQYIIKRKITS